ncbi:MAG: outer membrane protein assembly factor BamB family protein [Planctomycetota bacterium]|jgi:outer membrane protein assembly factor BamB
MGPVRSLAATVVCLTAAAVASARIPEARPAREILDAAGTSGGLIVHVGCGTGELTAELGAGEGYLVHGLDADGSNVEAARRHVLARGLYGKVTVDLFDGRRLPHIDNLVNLIVVSGDGRSVPRRELMRVLAPGGVVMVDRERTVKPRPPEIGEWTHWLHGPGNNAVSPDTKVGISRNLQWIMPPLWSRHHNLLPSVSAMVSSGGRIFYIIDEGPIAVKGGPDRWALVARDAFNGLFLWRRRIANWGWKRWSKVEFSGLMRFKAPSQVARRLVAAGDVVYATLGFDEPVEALDAATGETLRRFAGTEHASEILYRDGILAIARNTDAPGKDVMAVDARTGKVLWERKGFGGVTAHGDELKAYTDAYLTMGRERLFMLDGDDLRALDLASGRDAWRRPRPEMKKGVLGHYEFNHVNLCSLTYHEGILLLGQMQPFPDNLNKRQEKAMVIRAHDAATGRLVWERPGVTLAHFTPPDLMVRGGLVWTFKGKPLTFQGLDVRTGEPRNEYAAKDIPVGHHHRCYRNKATARYYLAGEEGIEYVDFDSGEVDVHHWVRGACRYGVMPANGLVYLPTHHCGCHANTLLNGFIALGVETGTGKPTPDADRLERVAGIAVPDGPPAKPDDWPAYKHDSLRSNRARAPVPARAPAGEVMSWTREVAPSVTAPVVACGGVYVGSPDGNTVCRLDAQSGEVAWRFVADGPVDTPPTYCKGKVLFGTRGGSVYALAAADGNLLWRFRAAPTDARLTAFGRLESPWPVHGSVLVMDGKAYCVAGRSMNLDSGLHVYALDVDSGKPLQHANLKADPAPKGETRGAVLPDILVGDGASISMRTMKLDPRDITKHGPAKRGAYLSATDGGLLDRTWFNSSYWQYRLARAQMLVFDDDGIYGIRSIKRFVTKSYGQDIFTAGKGGYQLFAAKTTPGVKPKGGGEPGAKPKKGRKRNPSPKDAWVQRIGIRARAMALTDDHILIAGTRDVLGLDTDDPWAALEGRAGGVVAVFAREGGAKLWERDLATPPVLDGIAVTGDGVFMSLDGGSVARILDEATK